MVAWSRPPTFGRFKHGRGPQGAYRVRVQRDRAQAERRRTMTPARMAAAVLAIAALRRKLWGDP